MLRRGMYFILFSGKEANEVIFFLKNQMVMERVENLEEKKKKRGDEGPRWVCL